MTGVVSSFRGSFGWIECDDGSGDAYVHFSDIKIKGNGYRKLIPGQNVEFTLIQQKGGKLKAVNVAATGGFGSSFDGGRGGYGGRGRGRGRGGGYRGGGYGRGGGYRGGRGRGRGRR